MKFLLVLLCTSICFMLPSDATAAYRLKKKLSTATVSQHNTADNELSIQNNIRIERKSAPTPDQLSLAAAACLIGSVMCYLFLGVSTLLAGAAVVALGVLAIILGLKGARGDRLSRLKPVGGISAFFGFISTLFGIAILALSANRR